jgi:NAD(P)H-hydrate epimerase
MNDKNLAQQLADLFREAGRAHHQAFLATNGADAEWPLWYADYLLEKLRQHLAADLTKSELVYLLVAADREQKRLAPKDDWPTFYAKFFLKNYE